MPKKRTKSSQRWLKEHASDIYVKRARQAGYRSRAVYKLLAIQEKDKIIKQGAFIVDLGAAPGGWSQLVSELVGRRGHVFALDILPIAPMEGVQIIQGDFTEQYVLDKLLAVVDEHKIDLVLSDMAPNMSGERSIDQPRMMYLAELALEAAQLLLKKEGTLLVKVFQGEGFEQYMTVLKAAFDRVKVCKPKASRARSAEIYVLAKGYKAL